MSTRLLLAASVVLPPVAPRAVVGLEPELVVMEARAWRLEEPVEEVVGRLRSYESYRRLKHY